MTLGKVTVVIATYNSAPFIRATVHSVRNQFFPEVQLIAVDNNSTDSTLEVLRELDVPSVTESIQGGGAARNRGLSGVTTESVLFLDDDDLLQPHALSSLNSLLQETGADAVYGRIRNHLILGHANKSIVNSTPKFLSTSRLAPLASSTFIRRSTFTKYGIFDHDNFSFARWIVRARHAGARFEGLDAEVALRGIHGGNVSLKENSMAEFFKIIRARTSHGGNSQ